MKNKREIPEEFDSGPVDIIKVKDIDFKQRHFLLDEDRANDLIQKGIAVGVLKNVDTMSARASVGIEFLSMIRMLFTSIKADGNSSLEDSVDLDLLDSLCWSYMQEAVPELKDVVDGDSWSFNPLDPLVAGDSDEDITKKGNNVWKKKKN